MQILEILKTKPHNKHYLNRYYRFIENCMLKNSSMNTDELGYTEKHHICPKSKDMFPEYKNLKKYPWNMVILTYRQHIIAHLLLWKAYDNISQTLSIIRTINQPHVKVLSLKSINTKLYSQIKKDLSDKKKGIFTRGYDENGVPNVSIETRILLSEQKTEFYSHEQNRINHSIACTGAKRNNTTNMRNYSLNRSESHKENLSLSISNAWELKKLNGTSKRIKYGVFVTPFGNFSSCPGYGTYCKNPDKVFTIHQIKKNPKLNRFVIGKTPRELGFFFVIKTDQSFEQYCECLNQAHLPEPNHVLWSELNDYLLREKLLP